VSGDLRWEDGRVNWLVVTSPGQEVRSMIGGAGDTRTTGWERPEVVEAASAREAADVYRSRLSVWELEHGLEVQVHLLGTAERFRIEYAEKGRGDWFGSKRPVTIGPLGRGKEFEE
jgi:hypothetical protein